MAHRGYVSSRLVHGQLVPQRVQNLVIRDYCRQSKFNYLLSLTEYVIEDSFVMLATLLEELPSLDGIVFYSLFQLPGRKEELWKIFNKISNHQKEIHFAVENICARDLVDFNRVEEILMVSSTIPDTLKIENIRELSELDRLIN